MAHSARGRADITMAGLLPVGSASMHAYLSNNPGINLVAAELLFFTFAHSTAANQVVLHKRTDQRCQRSARSFPDVHRSFIEILDMFQEGLSGAPFPAKRTSVE